jgi:hypothetical protein
MRCFTTEQGLHFATICSISRKKKLPYFLERVSRPGLGIYSLYNVRKIDCGNLGPQTTQMAESLYDLTLQFIDLAEL